MNEIERLREKGCHVDEAIARCGGDVAFYLELVQLALAKERYEGIKLLLETKNYKGAFEAAHALKGVVINLSLTPMEQIAIDMTEKLRPQQPVDLREDLTALLQWRESLEACM